tara:strand:+ start:561 stop:1007 length:447 start_codon:yes stop_codon:yes gene_type:complete
MNSYRIYIIVLTLAGLIPFVCLPLSAYFGAIVVENWANVHIAYAGIITSFMTGTIWGVALSKQAHPLYFIAAIIPALLAWIAILIMPLFFAYGLLIMLLGALRLIEDGLAMPQWYVSLRNWVTLIAVISLIGGLVLSLPQLDTVYPIS